jgi:hypothetical protein
MSRGENAAGMVPGETPVQAPTPPVETPAAFSRRLAARKPVTGWLCLSCRTETPSDCEQAIPCCPDQFAVRFAFLPPLSLEAPCHPSPDA